jgi:hypothetical protein
MVGTNNNNNNNNKVEGTSLAQVTATQAHATPSGGIPRDSTAKLDEGMVSLNSSAALIRPYLQGPLQEEHEPQCDNQH